MVNPGELARIRGVDATKGNINPPKVTIRTEGSMGSSAEVSHHVGGLLCIPAAIRGREGKLAWIDLSTGNVKVEEIAKDDRRKHIWRHRACLAHPAAISIQ